MIQEILTAFAEIVALSGLGLIFVSAFLTDTQKSPKIVNSLQDGIANDSPNVQQEFELEEEFTQLPFLIAYEMAERFGVKVDTIVAHAKQWRNGQRYDYSFEEWASDFDTKYRWHSTLHSTPHPLPQRLHILELRPFPRLLHRAIIPSACWWSLPIYPQTAARPLRRNGVQTRLRKYINAHEFQE